MPSRPLISFYVIACNQQRFVAEAIAGALAQTWSPLEVVLSDDCSDDNTFQIMRNIAESYRGHHTVVLNRNENRLGIGAHINRILKLCHGEWIVASAGDDISLPGRTEELYSTWIGDGARAGLVYSNIMEIREDGTDWYLNEFVKQAPGNEPWWDYRKRLTGHCPPMHGAAFAYPRRIFDEFGPLWDGVVFEDNILNWRAELSGGVLLCSDALVRHRNHDNQITNKYSKGALLEAGNRRRLLQWSDVVTRRQNIADAHIAFKKYVFDEEMIQKADRLLTEQLRSQEAEYELYWGTFIHRWRLMLSCAARGKRANQLLFAAMPRPLYLAALRSVAKWRSK